MDVTVPTHYSVAQLAVMFKCRPSRIKERCLAGDFDYTVSGGRWHITRESVLRHLPELEMKNNAETRS